MNNWKNVFDNYPDVDQIYIVDDMPFLRADQAQAHGVATGKPVEHVSRFDQETSAEEAGEDSTAEKPVVTVPAKKKVAKK